MGNMCLYEPISGQYPKCNGACKKGKDNYCEYYYVDEVCTILKQWMTEAGVKEPLLIKYDYERKKLIIHTTKPGYLIGRYGTTIDKYSELLNKELRFRFTDFDGVPQKQSRDFIELVECNDAII